MFDELDSYKDWGHFFLKSGDKLKTVCNAPSDKSGVYVVYALKKGRIELVYIGSSGKMNKDGTMFVRKSGLGGIKDRLVNGHQFGKMPRRISWPYMLEIENIEALDVYWYVTHSDKINDCPVVVENMLLSRYSEVYGSLPRWNNQ
jgi:hypothetical protein